MYSVKGFFDNKSVLITGATGFVGKLVVEKLLRTCPDLTRLHLLIRPKNNVPTGARAATFLDDPVFSTLRGLNPNFGNKISFHRADLKTPRLGLSAYEQKQLSQDVNVVLHVAANISFGQPLLKAMETNYLGTKRMLEFSREMKNLASIVHISSTYAHFCEATVEEEIYPINENIDLLLTTLRKSNEHEQKEIQKKVLGNMPNSYLYSKKCTEVLVDSYRNQLPLSIVRPSTVGAALTEPTPGYIDNFNTTTGCFYLLGSGQLRFQYANPEKRLDLIPADLVANTVIAAAAAGSSGPLGMVKIYNCTSSNPPTLGEVTEELKNECHKGTIGKARLLPGPPFIVTTSKFWVITEFVIKGVAAFLTDLLLFPWKRNFKSTKLCFRVYKGISVFEGWLINDWKYKNANLQSLSRWMMLEDKKMFPLPTDKAIDYRDYVRLYMCGISQLLARKKTKKAFKENLSKRQENTQSIFTRRLVSSKSTA